MTAPQVILSRLQTADGHAYNTLNYVYFDISMVDLVNTNGNGKAEAVGEYFGRLPIPGGLQSATYARGGEEYVNIVLNTQDTYSTPEGLINQKIAELQAKIAELQALIGG